MKKVVKDVVLAELKAADSKREHEEKCVVKTNKEIMEYLTRNLNVNNPEGEL